MFIFPYRFYSRSFSYYSKRFLSSLLIVEHENGNPSQSTLQSLSATLSIGGDVLCLVAGEKNQDTEYVAQTMSKIEGISNVYLAQNKLFKNYFVEHITNIVISLMKKLTLTHIAMSASTLGKSVIPHLAGKLNVAPISEVTGIINENTFIRSVYAGNGVVTLLSHDITKIFTIRSSAFPVVNKKSESVSIDKIDVPQPDNCRLIWKGCSIASSDRPDLSQADIVVSGGRGLKSGENFELLYILADKIGAAVGASRAAVDAGFVQNEMQVGQTGKIVAPQLYIAVGISGAIQHLAGMKDSKTIVCINNDPEAPIFHVSDYGLVADLFVAIPELTSLI